jgi:hypothetical protein
MKPNSGVASSCGGIDPKTFVINDIGEGFRSFFDYSFRTSWFPLRAQDKTFDGAPYENPIVSGNSYGLRRELFFQLGELS